VRAKDSQTQPCESDSRREQQRSGNGSDGWSTGQGRDDGEETHNEEREE